MPHYRRLYADEPLATWWTIAMVAVGVIAGALGIAFGAVQGLSTTSGFADEASMAFPASLWVFIYGIVLLVAIAVFWIDAWVRHSYTYVTPPGWLSYFWMVLFAFLVLPWNFIGHVYLMRAWTATGDWSATAVYAMVIIFVIISYFIILGVARFVAFVLFVHNWQIGVSRRYLTAVSDAANSNRPLPILEERYRVLPYVMETMNAEEGGEPKEL